MANPTNRWRFDMITALAMAAAVAAVYGFMPRVIPGRLPYCSSLDLPWRLFRACAPVEVESGTSGAIRALIKGNAP